MKLIYIYLIALISFAANAEDICSPILLPEYESIKVKAAHAVNDGFVFDARAVEGQTQETLDVIDGVDHVRTETILDLMIGHLPKSVPDLSSLLGIYRINQNQLLYPNVTLLNQRLDRLDGTVWESAVRFQEVRGDQEITPYVYAQLWVAGFHPYAVTGWWHFHDLGVHGIGAVLLPKKVVRASRQLVNFWLKCAEDPALSLNSAFHAFALQQVERLSEDVDTGTSRMVSGAHALHRPGHFGWSWQTLISKGILLHPEFREPSPALYIEAKKLMNGLESKLFDLMYEETVRDRITPEQLPELAAEAFAKLEFTSRFKFMQEFNQTSNQSRQRQ